MKKLNLILLFLILILRVFPATSQTLSKIGLKAGINWSGLTASNADEVFGEFSPPVFSFLSPDFGVYAEMFNHERYNLCLELHYLSLGESPNVNYKVAVPRNPNQGEIYNYKNASDRFHFISLQVLPRFRFGLTKDDKVYFLLGPRFDYLLNNSYSDETDEYSFTNSKIEVGLIAGLGGEVIDEVNFEFRLSYGLTGAYKVNYGSASSSRRFVALSFMAGYCLKNFAKDKKNLHLRRR